MKHKYTILLETIVSIISEYFKSQNLEINIQWEDNDCVLIETKIPLKNDKHENYTFSAFLSKETEIMLAHIEPTLPEHYFKNITQHLFPFMDKQLFIISIDDLWDKLSANELTELELNLNLFL